MLTGECANQPEEQFHPQSEWGQGHQICGQHGTSLVRWKSFLQRQSCKCCVLLDWWWLRVMTIISRGAFIAVRRAAEACQGLFLWVEAARCGLGQQGLTSLSLQKCSVNSILLIISVCLSVLLVSCFHPPSSLSPSVSLSLCLSISLPPLSFPYPLSSSVSSFVPLSLALVLLWCQLRHFKLSLTPPPPLSRLLRAWQNACWAWLTLTPLSRWHWTLLRRVVPLLLSFPVRSRWWLSTVGQTAPRCPHPPPPPPWGPPAPPPTSTPQPPTLQPWTMQRPA